MSDLGYVSSAEVVGNEILAALAIEAEALKGKLTPEDRLILERAAKRLAVVVAERVRATDEAEIARINEDSADVIAVLENYRAIMALVLARASGRVAQAAATILGRVARGLLAGALGVGL